MGIKSLKSLVRRPQLNVFKLSILKNFNISDTMMTIIYSFGDTFNVLLVEVMFLIQERNQTNKKNTLLFWKKISVRSKLCVLCNGISDSILVGSSKVFKFVSVLVENKSWHSLNSFLACNVTCFIYINLKTSFLKQMVPANVQYWTGIKICLLVDFDRNKSPARLEPCTLAASKCCIDYTV